MTLGKLTIESSVKYVSKVDHSHSEQAPQIRNRRKNTTSNTIKLSQKNKKLNKNITREGFKTIK